MRIGSSCAAVTGYDFPLGQSPKHLGGEGGKKVRCRTGIISQEPEYLSGSPHSVAVALCATPARLTETRLQQKLLRKKKNESWAMRRFENIRGLTSPTLGVGGNLLCKIVQFGSGERGRWCGFGVAPKHLSSESSESDREPRALLQSDSPLLVSCHRLHWKSYADSFAGVKRRWSQSSSQRRVSIFRWINRPQARA